MSSIINYKKENQDQNLFLTENLFSKNHLDLGFSRNSKYFHKSNMATCFNLPKLMQNTTNSSGTFSQHKKTVLQNLLKLQERLDEFNKSPENIKFLSSDNDFKENSPLKTFEQNNKSHVNTFLKSFNEQLKKKKVYIIDSENIFKFENTSIANAINTNNDEKNSLLIRELMDLRLNNYNMIEYIKNRDKDKIDLNIKKKQFKDSKKQSIEDRKLLNKSRINNNMNDPTKKIPILLDDLKRNTLKKNISFRNKVPYYFNDTVTELNFNQINSNVVPELPDVYKNISLNKVLTVGHRVFKPFKFK